MTDNEDGCLLLGQHTVMLRTLQIINSRYSKHTSQLVHEAAQGLLAIKLPEEFHNKSDKARELCHT